MPNALERIRVSGFKSIRELDLELHALNILIGANGSGKSNFVSLFQLLNEILGERLQAYTGSVGANSLLYYGRATTSAIEVELSFSSSYKDLANGYEIRLIPSDEDRLIFDSEVAWFHNRSQYPKPLTGKMGSGHKETALYSHTHRIVDYVIQALSSWKIYHFHDTSRSSKMKQTQNLHDNERLQPDASNIAAFLYLLQEKYPDHYKRIVRTIRRVTPFFDDFVLAPLRLDEDKIWLQWRDINSENPFNPHVLSDGTLRFICLATLLLQPELPSVILIDEPELGLHPYAITLLAGLLKSAATQTQVIVSTQSVPLINQFDPQDILVVDRKDRQSVFRRLKEKEFEAWMSEYGLGDLWEKNVIGGRPQPESA